MRNIYDSYISEKSRLISKKLHKRRTGLIVLSGDFDLCDKAIKEITSSLISRKVKAPFQNEKTPYNHYCYFLDHKEVDKVAEFIVLRDVDKTFKNGSLAKTIDFMQAKGIKIILTTSLSYDDFIISAGLAPNEVNKSGGMDFIKVSHEEIIHKEQAAKQKEEMIKFLDELEPFELDVLFPDVELKSLKDEIAELTETLKLADCVIESYEIKVKLLEERIQDYKSTNEQILNQNDAILDSNDKAFKIMEEFETEYNKLLDERKSLIDKIEILEMKLKLSIDESIAREEEIEYLKNSHQAEIEHLEDRKLEIFEQIKKSIKAAFQESK